MAVKTPIQNERRYHEWQEKRGISGCWKQGKQENHEGQKEQRGYEEHEMHDYERSRLVD
jgi:hypothetical protein